MLETYKQYLEQCYKLPAHIHINSRDMKRFHKLFTDSSINDSIELLAAITSELGKRDRYTHNKEQSIGSEDNTQLKGSN